MSRRLHEHAQAAAQRRQKTYEEQLKWYNNNDYYKNFERNNTRYSNWTSDEYYDQSTNKYKEKVEMKKKHVTLEERRAKLKKLLQDEENEYQMEITNSPRSKSSKSTRDYPLDVLKDINFGLKLNEENKRRHEAELKLYHKWRDENPIIRDYESKHNRAGLKMAWLDQQIEKKIEEERTVEETKKLIKERDELMRKEEELERIERENTRQKEKHLMMEINKKLEEYKINQREADKYKSLEDAAMIMKKGIDKLQMEHDDDIRIRRQKEVALQNINLARIKLKQRAKDIEEQLKSEKEFIEKINSFQAAEEAEESEIKRKNMEDIKKCIECIKHQQQVEKERQKYISFIFDSEAKNVWAKQEIMWQEEQSARDKLFQNVLQGINKQVEYKLLKAREEQQKKIMEIEESRRAADEMEMKLRREREEFEQRLIERKTELGKQINDKLLDERRQHIEHKQKQLEDLQKLREEEDRLKQEIINLQKQTQNPSKFHRKKMFW